MSRPFLWWLTALHFLIILLVFFVNLFLSFSLFQTTGETVTAFLKRDGRVRAGPVSLTTENGDAIIGELTEERGRSKRGAVDTVAKTGEFMFKGREVSSPIASAASATARRSKTVSASKREKAEVFSGLKQKDRSGKIRF